ncbi:MAG: hypothetical protein U9R44_05710 [Candidatus Omnitrophota bacterium]|nr:hypothetical protein [Candidatus Omnitrophota bacterium]
MGTFVVPLAAVSPGRKIRTVSVDDERAGIVNTVIAGVKGFVAGTK